MSSGTMENAVGTKPGFRILSLVVSMVLALLVAITVFGSSNSRVSYAASRTTTAASLIASQAPFGGWNSAVIGVGHAGAVPALNVYNYNPVSGKHVVLVPQPPYLPLTTHIDGVSPDGQNLLYHFSNSGHTLYYTLTPLSGTGFFYELNDATAGNALWESDSRHVLILSLGVGVSEVDTQTGQSRNLLPLPLSKSGVQVQIGRLTFYRNGYLYFVGAEGACQDILCRVQLSSRAVQQVSFRSLGATYWLSPDGATVYFANKQGPAGIAAIYAVNSDGSNLRVLRQYPQGTPIGYAADNSLEIMTVANGKFEIVKLGATQQQDQVVLANVAPGSVNLCNPNALAGAICDANIALAPYGHAVIVVGVDANANYEVWSDDLTTGNKHVLFTVSDHYQIVLPGWDRRPVA